MLESLQTLKDLKLFTDIDFGILQEQRWIMPQAIQPEIFPAIILGSSLGFWWWGFCFPSKYEKQKSSAAKDSRERTGKMESESLAYLF